MWSVAMGDGQEIWAPIRAWEPDVVRSLWAWTHSSKVFHADLLLAPVFSETLCPMVRPALAGNNSAGSLGTGGTKPAGP